MRIPVVAVFVVGLVATIASAPGEPLVLESGLGSNQVLLEVDLAASQQVRFRATLDASGVTADAPTTPSVSATVASIFDDAARAGPARVRAGLLAPDDVSEVGLLTFFSPDESHSLFGDGDVVDLLLVREDDGAGVVALDVSLSGEVSGEGDIEFSGSPVLSVEPVSGQGEGEGTP